jgi:tryptophan synthase alpha subunit
VTAPTPPPSGERETVWHAPTAKALREALLPLADNLPSDLSEIGMSDPANDGPVILAWSVDALAQRLAAEMAERQVGAQHACPDEPWKTLRVLATFLNSGSALMKSRAHREGAQWCLGKVQQLRDGEITVEQMQGSGGVR